MPGLYQQIAMSTGRTDLPVIYRDQMIDPGCVSLLDLGHAWGYKAQASPIAAGTVLRNYRRSGTTVAINGTPVWSGGMMVLNGLVTNGILGAEWKLPSTATHFAIGGYMKIPLTGFAINGTGNGTAGIFGWSLTNGGNAQYGVNITYDKATGIASAVYLAMNAQQINIKPYIPTDGLAHHYVFEFVVVTSSTFQMKMYVDGVLVVTSNPLAWTGSLIVPSSGVPTLGAYYPTMNDAKGAHGRPWLWDLSVAGSKSITDLIAADIAQNAGRFS